VSRSIADRHGIGGRDRLADAMLGHEGRHHRQVTDEHRQPGGRGTQTSCWGGERELIAQADRLDDRQAKRCTRHGRDQFVGRDRRAVFDVVALNPYAPDAEGVLEKANLVRAYMNRRGDRSTPIWVTEVGWATGGPRSPFRTTKRGQAARIGHTFGLLIAARGRLRLGRVIVFGLQDRSYVASEVPWWGPRVGLFDLAGRPKPAWSTFLGFTGGRRGGRLRSVTG
jgi:hypothetical protein